MAHKRPFDDEVVDEGSFKHQRQDEPNGDFSFEGASGKSNDIGESSIQKNEMGSSKELENGSYTLFPREVVEDIETDFPTPASLSHWTNNSTSDEDEPSEEMVQLPFNPGFVSFDHSVRPVINPEDVYHLLLDYPPRKRVPVGPDHQADIPNLGTREDRNAIETCESQSSDGNSRGIIDGDLAGFCVIPIPKTEPLPYNGEKVGFGRVECLCSDQGSMRCVRQHILEAREKLRSTLGQDTFMELGFDDMGEVVADKWSKDEEQLFHEVVYANPVSLGKNFWNVLSNVFSSRTKMEIVSYYFNVFMLRKRAEQNRADPLNIDSDNDEWQGSDDDDDDDENSGIESPIHHNIPGFYHYESHLHDHDNDNEHDHDHADVFVKKSDLDSISAKKSDGDGENDVQDGSCMSSDSGPPVLGPRLKPDNCQEWSDYIIGSSDVKEWDGFSLSCPKQSVEFLPTCSMIEEVFGDGDFDSKTKRW